ncbi:endospore germination permease [Paenibacillus sp. NPDC058071]|uniref:GerAB/ArcD/ProY family transporter n=1 Tax=Paenibacillus sp. NPDC058071 TaxID=3346326 RepID=UPI0036DD1F92
MQTSVNGKITVRQFTILIILGVVGDTILVLPTITGSFAKQDAWLSMFLALLLGMATAFLYAGIANKMKRKSWVEAAQSQLGVFVGSLFSILFLFQIFMCASALLSETSQFLTTQMMPETPVNAMLIVFMTVIIIAYRYGVETFARMGEMLFPVFIILFLFLVLCLLPQIKMSNMKPVLAEGMYPFLKGMLPAYAYGFTEMVTLLMLVPHVAGNGKLTKPIFIGYAVGGIILLITVDFCVLVLGANLMETKYYPTFVLAQKITIGKFVERIEVILAFLWIITVFYKTLMLFFSLISGIAQFLRLKESNMLTIPIGMILIVSSVLTTPNIVVYNDILNNYYPWFDIVFCVLLPVIFFVALHLASLLGGKHSQKK